jgi:hypothetical protein
MLKAQYILFLFLASLVGCSSVPTYQGPQTQDSPQVDVTAVGLMYHAAFPNDMVWLWVLDAAAGTVLGSIRITHDKPQTSISLDHDKAFLLRFSSVQSHFGGYSSCGADVPLTPKRGERFSVIYSTEKWRCHMEASLLTAGGGKTRVAFVEGGVGGVQYEARVVR